jgi:hypothetical protein
VQELADPATGNRAPLDRCRRERLDDADLAVRHDDRGGAGERRRLRKALPRHHLRAQGAAGVGADEPQDGSMRRVPERVGDDRPSAEVESEAGRADQVARPVGPDGLPAPFAGDDAARNAEPAAVPAAEEHARQAGRRNHEPVDLDVARGQYERRAGVPAGRPPDRDRQRPVGDVRNDGIAAQPERQPSIGNGRSAIDRLARSVAGPESEQDEGEDAPAHSAEHTERRFPST